MGKRTLWRLPHWTLWLLCILLIVPAMLSVPGNPDAVQLSLYLGLFGTVTSYPVALPVLMMLEFFAGRSGNRHLARIYRNAIWITFALAFSILAIFFGSIAIGEVLRPAPVSSEMRDLPQHEPRPFAKPILHRNLPAVQRLISAGVDLDQRMFNGATPAITAASSENWRIVLALLDAGADARLANRMGLTVAELARTSRVTPDSDEGRALALVREQLRKQGLY